ncbi:MAG: hypothetical protein F4X59_17035 [Holophagales bacterium]|nr:hypothetical protein [Holophagales bacterium]MYC11811.1 hypothetical protein [Holophagales bacterium]
MTRRLGVILAALVAFVLVAVVVAAQFGPESFDDPLRAEGALGVDLCGNVLPRVLDLSGITPTEARIQLQTRIAHATDQEIMLLFRDVRLAEVQREADDARLDELEQGLRQLKDAFREREQKEHRR